MTYLGPVLWEGQDEELPGWVSGLSPDRPLIWLYAGNPQYNKRSDTPFDSRAVITACCEALGGMDAQVALTTGHHELPQRDAPLYPKISGTGPTRPAWPWPGAAIC